MSIPLTGNWSYPTAMRFGAGRISELAEACASLSLSRPLLVTDPGLRDLPFIAQAKSDCEAAGLGVQVFSDLKPNPTESNVTAGVAAYRDGDHDGVIAIGGGSAMDCGKCVAFMQARRGPWRISRTSATGGPVPMPGPSPRSSRCPPPRAPAQRWGAPRR